MFDFLRGVMKNWWVWFYGLSLIVVGVSAENPSFPGSTLPGFWGDMGSTLEWGSPSEESSPARRSDSLWLSLFWNDLNGLASCNQFGFSADWGRQYYRSAFLFSLMRMDSIYTALSFGGEFALQWGRFNLGYGHLWRIESVPGIDSWSAHRSKWGMHFQLIGGFSLGALYSIAYGEYYQWWGGLHWSSKSGTGFFIEYSKEKLNVGQVINFGAFSFQSALSYPGPQISMGLTFDIHHLLIGVGVYRSAFAFNSKSFHINRNWSR